jgi:hypothetical protein
MGKKTLLAIAAVVAASGALLSAPAQARGSVVLSLGVPAPVYSYGYPQPVYTQPYGYAQPYGYPQPGYVVAEPNIYIGPGYGYSYGHRYVRRDSDRDGVPDRFDRRPFNPRRR